MHSLILMECYGHKDGNTSINDEQLKNIKFLMLFISVGGGGRKLLIKNKTPITNRIYKKIIDEVSALTGLKIDHARRDISFISYDENAIYKGEEYDVKDNETSLINEIHKNNEVNKISESFNSPDIISPNKKLDQLDEILLSLDDHYEYNEWLKYVMTLLKGYGEAAIPRLERKWKSDQSYYVILENVKNGDVDCRDYGKLMENRIRLNGSAISKYKRVVVSGNPGSGKSEYAIKEIIKPNVNDGGYVVYFVQSVKQSYEFSNRIRNNGMTVEILVSNETIKGISIENRNKYNIRTKSDNASQVKIMMHRSFILDSWKFHKQHDERQLKAVIVDEITINHIIRSSIKQKASYEVATGSKISRDGIEALSKYSKSDKDYALKLAMSTDYSGFISSCVLLDNCDIFILTTELLSVKVLKDIRIPGA